MIKIWVKALVRGLMALLFIVLGYAYAISETDIQAISVGIIAIILMVMDMLYGVSGEFTEPKK